jgi:hypothetical protein
MNRIEKIKNRGIFIGMGRYGRTVSGSDKKVDLRPRHSILQAMENWYHASPVIPKEYEILIEKYKESKSRLSLTRWAIRNMYLDEAGASRLGSFLSGSFSFKLSCRFNDLLRLSDTPHFKSCFDYDSEFFRGAQMFKYSADPDIAVVYVPDKSGKFLWRALIRICVIKDNPDKLCLVLYRSYGNADELSIFRELDKIAPLYFACGVTGDLNIPKNKTRAPVADQDVKQMIGVSIQNNKYVKNNIWSDHDCWVDKDKKMNMYARRYREIL